jgi:hypothetical protein
LLSAKNRARAAEGASRQNVFEEISRTHWEALSGLELSPCLLNVSGKSLSPMLNNPIPKHLEQRRLLIEG